MTLERVTRLDVGGRLRSPRRDGRGFLRADGYASRIGVLKYPQADGTVRRELRLPEDVFSSTSLATFDGAQFTDDHPPEMITPANARRFGVGVIVGEGRRDGDHVAVTIHVVDGKTIEKMERGDARELSVGYRVDLDPTPGEHPVYGKYDAVQRNIEVNHVALVPRGRAGETAAVRMDGADVAVAEWDDESDATCVPSETRYNHDHKQGTDHMADPQKNDATVESLTKMLEAEKARADEATKRADKADADVKAATERADKAEGERDALKSERTDAANKLAEVTKERDELKAERDALKVRADAAESPDRLDIRVAAMRVLGEDVKFDGKDDIAIMTDVVNKLQPDLPLKTEEGKPAPSPAYVKARFDVAYEGFKKNAGQLNEVRETAGSAPAGSAAAKSARDEMIKRNHAASQSKAKE